MSAEIKPKSGDAGCPCSIFTTLEMFLMIPIDFSHDFSPKNFLYEFGFPLRTPLLEAQHPPFTL
jgi:hypothetical protein